MSKGKKIGYVFVPDYFLTAVHLPAVLHGMRSDEHERGCNPEENLIPGTYLLENYKSLIANQNLYRALWNSFRNCCSAYGSRACSSVPSQATALRFIMTKAKDIVFTILLTAMMVPFRSDHDSRCSGCSPD